jgi:hypothetical protein
MLRYLSRLPLVLAFPLVANVAFALDRTAPPASSPGRPVSSAITPNTGRSPVAMQSPRGSRPAGAAGRPTSQPRPRISSFDIDDNILAVPHLELVPLFDRQTGEQVGAIDLYDWRVRDGSVLERRAPARSHPGSARFELSDDGRTLVGSGPLSKYEIRVSKSGSIVPPRDEEQVFVKDLKLGLSKTGVDWQGPQWKSFVRAMERPETARTTTVITARGQTRQTLQNGFLYLKKQGLIEHVPEKENIFAVLDPDLTVGGRSLHGETPERKATVMAHLLDNVQKEVKAGPQGSAQRVDWSFSDDNPDNFKTAVEVFSHEVKGGRWPNVRISLVYSGSRDPSMEPHAVVIERDGSVRRLPPGQTAPQ